jgi:hypothetical protein
MMPYEVSDRGRVRRTDTTRIKRPTPDRKGYLRVFLYHDGRKRTRFVHQLVLRAFVGPCPLGQEANHRDGVKSNNRLANLEYVTPSENNQHAWDTGLMPRTRVRRDRCKRGHMKTVPVAQKMHCSGRSGVYLRCRECHRESDRRRSREKLRGEV